MEVISLDVSHFKKMCIEKRQWGRWGRQQFKK
jgi:hypothetical protein